MKLRTRDYIIKRYGIQKKTGIRTIPGKTRAELAELLKDLKFNRGVEIGVARGNFSEMLVKTNPDLHLVGIDPYQNYESYKFEKDQEKMNKLYQVVRKKMSVYPNYDLWRIYSMDAVKSFPKNSIDFVYIDGNHQLKYVIEDLVEWSKIVKPGGIIAGHDYRYEANRKGNAQVIWALKAFCYIYNVQPLFVIGREGTQPKDHFRSWFMVKTWNE